jgi:hypothetical protein
MNRQGLALRRNQIRSWFGLRSSTLVANDLQTVRSRVGRVVETAHRIERRVGAMLGEI